MQSLETKSWQSLNSDFKYIPINFAQVLFVSWEGGGGSVKQFLKSPVDKFWGTYYETIRSSVIH